MGAFERLIRRRERWLFLFVLDLAIAAFGLVLMEIGIVTGWAAATQLGIMIAVPGTAGAAAIVSYARRITQKGPSGAETHETSASLSR